MRVLLAVLLVGIAGCGGDDISPGGAAPTPPKSTRAKVVKDPADTPQAKVEADPVTKPKPGSKSKTDRPVFSGLQPVGKRLNQIGAAIIQGNGPDIEKAWSSWHLPPTAPPKLADQIQKQFENTRTKLGDAGVTRLQNLGFGFRLFLLNSNQLVYRLDGFLLLDQKQASLTKFGGGPASGTIGSRKLQELLPKELKGPDRIFPEVFKSLLKAVRSGERTRLTIADPDLVAKSMMLPPILVADMTKQVASVKRRFAATCQELATIEYDTVRIEIEDQSFLARDANGQSLGVLQGRFGVLDKKLIYVVGGFRPFPQPR